jgi:hypothetical protein
MGTLFLTTVLSCQQLTSIANRLIGNKTLTIQQRNEILIQLRNDVPSCPLIIKSNDTKRTSVD